MTQFSEQLTRLALAVSVVDDQIWADLCGSLDVYFKRNVGACYWEISIGGTRVDNAPGLRIIYTSDGAQAVGNTYSLDLDAKGAFKDFRTYAYVKGKALWIVDKNGRKLNEVDISLEDRWSGAQADKQFPRSFPGDYARGARTIFIDVLEFQGNNFGIFVLEHEDEKALTPEIERECVAANSALSRLVRTWQTTKEQLDVARDARATFNNFVEKFSSIAEPKKIFVASPRDRDQEVWAAISKVLNKKKYRGRFKLVNWDEKTQPGDIMEQIVKDVFETAVGVCLFSETLSSVEDNHQSPSVRAPDNPNVVFEAGLLQALVNNPEQLCTAILPVREHENLAGKPFFDISHERLCTIDRDESNNFLATKFLDKFEKMLDHALSGL